MKTISVGPHSFCAVNGRLLIAVCLFGIANLTPAGDTVPSKQPGQHVHQDLGKWDTNKDGRLEPNESEALRREKIREYQDEFDARAKGAAASRRAQETASKTRLVPPALLKRYDVNTNGVMDKQEWNAYKQDLARRKAEKQRAP